jgi:antirestriction protein ArdC
MSNVYSRFYQYSFLNCLLLYSQGVSEPVATYKRWAEMGRQVQKGSKAKAILRPISIKTKNAETGEDESKVKGFKMVNCLFTVSETEGEPLPEYELPEWSPATALEALDVREVPFAILDGNTAGYSVGREFAINPVAPYPLKTTFHELAHIQLGHTAPDAHAAYQEHRGTAEFQAEAVAYIVMNELGMAEFMDAPESRSYIQGWLRGDMPSDQDIRQVFTVADKILKAGRPVATSTQSSTSKQEPNA